MAASIIGGLLEQGLPVENIRASDPNPEALDRLKNLAPLALAQDNQFAVEGADVVVLAVKPQVMHQVALEIASEVQKSAPLVVSIAAGIRCDALSAWLGDGVALIRTMPNTPAMIQCGATALFATWKRCWLVAGRFT